MSQSGISRRAVAGAALLLVVVGVLASAPAQADPETGPYNAWAHREDATAPTTATTYAWSGPDTGLHLGAFSGQLVVYSDSSGGPELAASFVPPAGQTLTAGVTYRADALPAEPTAEAGRLLVWRDGTMCGRTEDQLLAGYRAPNPATGSFHVSEIERDSFGKVTRFAATYELNCQIIGQPGFEGTIAVNATEPPAPVPDAPATSGPVTGLTATNVGPSGGGTNSTTLTWHDPAGYGDTNVDFARSTDHAQLPAAIGAYGAYGEQLYLGRASRYYDDFVEFMSTRTYRVVPRGPSGRLGPPTLLTVLGTRLSIPHGTQRITIGQEAQISGRLTEAFHYIDPADVMKGPPLANRSVVLCRNSSVHYVDGACSAVDRTKTTADGRFSLSVTPMANSSYNVMVPATGQMVGNSSRVINALVAPHADLSARESERVSARASIRRGSIIHFSTSRNRAGSRGVIRLERYDGHAWRAVVTKRLASGARRLAVPYRERSRGLHTYRVVKPGDARHINGYSRTVRVRVR